MELSASAEINGQRVTLTAKIDTSPAYISPGRNEEIPNIDQQPLTTASGVRDAALNAMQLVLRNEAQRLADIVYDDVRSAPIERRWDEHHRAHTPAERPVTIVAVGTKDESIDGQPTRVVAWRQKDGTITHAPDKVKAFTAAHRKARGLESD
jgi:hypothetical protein